MDHIILYINLRRLYSCPISHLYFQRLGRAASGGLLFHDILGGAAEREGGAARDAPALSVDGGGEGNSILGERREFLHLG